MYVLLTLDIRSRKVAVDFTHSRGSCFDLLKEAVDELARRVKNSNPQYLKNVQYVLVDHHNPMAQRALDVANLPGSAYMNWVDL